MAGSVRNNVRQCIRAQFDQLTDRILAVLVALAALDVLRYARASTLCLLFIAVDLPGGHGRKRFIPKADVWS